MTNREKALIAKALHYFGPDGNDYWKGVEILLDMLGESSVWLDCWKNGESITIEECMKRARAAEHMKEQGDE